jgi:micrococcal nuclease
LLLGAVTASCDGGGSACGPTSGTVARVVDGDTIELASGERVRYLLVDTPESTGGATDCFGAEAALFNTELTLGKMVTLRYDEAACTDRFDRLLAYVSVDGREVNTLLVERGYGCVLYVPPAGEDRRDEFDGIEAAARAASRGVWGACEEVTCD